MYLEIRLYKVLRYISWYLDISFAEETTYYVYSYNGKDFRILTQPSEHGLYFEEFRFTLAHPRGNLNETAYFIYSEASSSQSFLTSKLDPSGYKKFPLDVVVLSNERVGGNSRSVHLIDRSNYGPMISLHDHQHVICCKGKQTSFYAHNVTEGKKTHSFVTHSWMRVTYVTRGCHTCDWCLSHIRSDSIAVITEMWFVVKEINILFLYSQCYRK